MKSLILLLGSSVLTGARDAQQPRAVPEVDLPALATTPDAAAAWRRWAAAGRTPEAPLSNAPSHTPNPLGATIRSVPNRRHV